ncbi:MAG TPA: hypothetical protein VNS02_06955 [Rhizobiaceae bacterium]|nr:hypothetical protein [Rhizobiaceae bacterium]
MSAESGNRFRRRRHALKQEMRESGHAVTGKPSMRAMLDENRDLSETAAAAGDLP